MGFTDEAQITEALNNTDGGKDAGYDGRHTEAALQLLFR